MRDVKFDLLLYLRQKFELLLMVWDKVLIGIFCIGEAQRQAQPPELPGKTVTL